MSPDILLGLDEARGESETVFSVMDRVTGEVTPIHFSDKPITLKEIKSVRDRLLGVSASWTAEVKLTHKQMRQLKRERKESGYKKPRLPRKLKKKLKTKVKLMRYISLNNH